MLSAIKNFFEQNISMDFESGSVPSKQTEHLQLATAALLIEMMNQDDKVDDKEIQAVRLALKQQFDLKDDEITQLCQLAEDELHNAVDYYQFTKLIAENFSQPQKVKIIELLWRVAFADNHLDSYEEHMVRRIADLIYVPHQDLIQTKLRAQKLSSGY